VYGLIQIAQKKEPVAESCGPSNELFCSINIIFTWTSKNQFLKENLIILNLLVSELIKMGCKFEVNFYFDLWFTEIYFKYNDKRGEING
jgi:hypothetical protein